MIHLACLFAMYPPIVGRDQRRLESETAAQKTQIEKQQETIQSLTEQLQETIHRLEQLENAQNPNPEIAESHDWQTQKKEFEDLIEQLREELRKKDEAHQTDVEMLMEQLKITQQGKDIAERGEKSLKVQNEALRNQLAELQSH